MSSTPQCGRKGPTGVDSVAVSPLVLVLRVEVFGRCPSIDGVTRTGRGGTRTHDRREASAPSCHARTQGEGGHLSARERASPQTESAPGSGDFWPLELEEMNTRGLNPVWSPYDSSRATTRPTLDFCLNFPWNRSPLRPPATLTRPPRALRPPGPPTLAHLPHPKTDLLPAKCPPSCSLVRMSVRRPAADAAAALNPGPHVSRGPGKHPREERRTRRERESRGVCSGHGGQPTAGILAGPHGPAANTHPTHLDT